MQKYDVLSDIKAITQSWQLTLGGWCDACCRGRDNADQTHNCSHPDLAQQARLHVQGDGEVLATRIAEAEMLLTKYSKENERLAGQNVELRQRRQFMDQDYTGTARS